MGVRLKRTKGSGLKPDPPCAEISHTDDISRGSCLQQARRYGPHSLMAIKWFGSTTGRASLGRGNLLDDCGPLLQGARLAAPGWVAFAHLLWEHGWCGACLTECAVSP